MPIDETKLNELLGRFVVDAGAGFHAANAVVGDRLGLYRALAAVMPATPAEVAAEANADERHLREWLAGQAAGGYITHHPHTQRHSPPPGQDFAPLAPPGLPP